MKGTSQLSQLKLWVWTLLSRVALDTTLCDKVCQWLTTCRGFSPGTPVSSTNKTDCHDIAEILLKVALNTIILTQLSHQCLPFCVSYEDRYIERIKLAYINCFSISYQYKHELLLKIIGFGKNVHLEIKNLN